MDPTPGEPTPSLFSGDHACLMYQDAEEQTATLGSLVKEALARGDRCLCLLGDRSPEEVAAGISARGIDPGREIRRGALVLSTGLSPSARSQGLDLAAMPEFLLQSTGEALAGGFPGLTLAVEMTGAAETEAGSGRLVEVEARLDQLLPGSRALAVCQYDLRRCPPGILHELLRLHPLAILAREVRRNPYYEPREIGSGPEAEARRAEWMIARLRETPASWGGDRLRRITDALPVLVAYVDSEQRYRFNNEAYKEWFGVSSSHPLGRHIRDIIGERAYSLVNEHIEAALAGRRVSFERPVTYDDGTVRYVSATYVPDFGERGEVRGFIALISDVTERKRAEDALQRSEELYRTLVESVDDAIVVKDTQGRYVAVNAEFLRRVERPKEEILGRTALEVLPPRAGSRIMDGDHQVLATGEPLEVEERFDRARARVCHVRKVPLRNSSGQVVGVVTVSRDITGRKAAEEALRESEERLRLALANSPDVVSFQDADLRYTWIVHPVAGFGADRVLGKTDFDLLPADQAGLVTDFKRRVLETGIGARAEFRLTLDDVEYFFDVAVEPRRGSDGHIVGIATYARDVTERKRLTEQLLRTQRLETVARTASQVAHDFNALLAPLAAYPGLIKSKLPPGHPAAHYCDVMAQAAQKMADINADMMALGAGGQLPREATDLNALVREVVELIPDLPDTLAVELSLTPGCLPVWGAPAQLVRLATNLLANAREAMGDAGRISMKTKSVYVDQPLDRYDWIEIGEYARLSIADSGPGIPPEVRDRIFDAFFTTKSGLTRRGCGLGLTIVQAIVRDHGGYLDLESEVGSGTTFHVYLPLHRNALKEKPVAGLRGGTETILVVDDDQLQITVLRDLLNRLGYRVETARSGEEAVAHLERHPVDLLILDMIMAPGINGAETYRQVLALRTGQRAIILSGNPRSEMVRQAQSLGAGAYVRKPVTLESLARAVREELDR